jgi:hypothetical protein
MLSKCTLCNSGYTERKGLIEHLRVFHRIQRPEDFAHEVEQVKAQKKTSMRTIHFRCTKFQCNQCDFETYLNSILEKHKKAKSHVEDHFRVKVMRVVLRRIEDDYEFQAGDLVVARLKGYPWWPGMINRCPKTNGFVDMLEGCYCIQFFEATKTTLAWIPFCNVRKYSTGDCEAFPITPNYQPNLAKRLQAGIEWADYVVDWSAIERLDYFVGSTKKRGRKRTLKPKNKNLKAVKERNLGQTRQPLVKSTTMMAARPCDDDVENKEDEKRAKTTP